MKISDRELREHCRAFNNDAFPTHCIAELLQRRAEVRRLRRALWEVRHRADYGHSVRLVIEAALAPKRKRRAK